MSAGLVFALFVASGAAERPPPKPTVTLHVSPRLMTADFINGRLITATLTIKNADEELWCPTIEWEFNEERSSQLSDCDPFSDTEAGDRALWVRRLQRRYYGRDSVTIIVRIMKNKKVIRRLEELVLVQ